MVILRGPLVVSPPIKLTLYFSDVSLSDLENSCNQISSNFGSVIARVKYFAFAPIAAMSLKLTANDLYAISSGESSLKKWTPSESVSVVVTN
jgi:hypothetical protein